MKTTVRKNVFLWLVPAKVEGIWSLPQGELAVTQQFQKLTGTLGPAPISNARLHGDEITFRVGTQTYTGRVDGNSMKGTIAGGGAWSAARK